MNVKDIINERRSFRSLGPIKIDEKIINELANAAKLAPSCFNNQPWRFVFVYEKSILKEIHAALSQGNEWAKSASMIIAIASKKDLDCNIKEREYFLFDTAKQHSLYLLKLDQSSYNQTDQNRQEYLAEDHL